MWWAFAAQTAMNFIGAEASYQADKAQWKAQTAWKKYQNTMVNLSNAINQNAITTNEVLAQKAFADQALKIKQGGIITQARVEVAAAAAGVKGRTVNQAMFDVQRNAANRERERQDSFVAANLAFDQQRLQSSMSAAMQQDYTYLPKPKSATYYLNAAMNSLNSYMGMQGSQGSGGSGNSGFKPSGNFYGPPAPLGSGSRYEITSTGETINWNGVRIRT